MQYKSMLNKTLSYDTKKKCIQQVFYLSILSRNTQAIFRQTWDMWKTQLLLSILYVFFWMSKCMSHCQYSIASALYSLFLSCVCLSLQVESETSNSEVPGRTDHRPAESSSTSCRTNPGNRAHKRARHRPATDQVHVLMRTMKVEVALL